MKKLLALSLALAAVATLATAAEPTRLRFAKGAFGTTWNGTIADGEHRFRRGLGKGQVVTVGGPDVYTWSLVSPRGQELGCDGAPYCAPDARSAPLPEGGDWTIVTDYRMSSCANCPSSRTRKVSVTVEVR